MPIRFFSDKNRPVHLGPYPLERMARAESVTLDNVTPFEPLSFVRADEPLNLVNAMDEYQSMMDAIRDGFTNKTRSSIPSSPQARAEHLKSFCYFQDAAMVVQTKRVPLGSETQRDMRRQCAQLKLPL